MPNFFLSYTQADQEWAEWIAWQLEAVRYTTVLQAWDFHPGQNFVLAMNEAAKDSERTLVVLSDAYLNSGFSQSEWSAAFVQDPVGDRVVPVRVRDCNPSGLLGPIAYIDLLRLSEESARKVLLAGVRRGRRKPAKAPAFPIAKDEAPEILRARSEKPSFPGEGSTSRRFYGRIAATLCVIVAIVIGAGQWIKYRRAVKEGNESLDIDRPGEARSAFDKALIMWPLGIDAEFGRDKALVWGGESLDPVAFERAVARLADRRPDDRHVLVMQANLLYARRKLQEARVLYARAIKASPRLAEAWFGLGNVDTDLSATDEKPDKRLSSAIDWYKRAIDISYATPKYHDNRAELLQRIGRIHEAIEEYRAIDDMYPLAHVELARLYWRQGSFGLAASEQLAALERLKIPEVTSAEKARHWEFAGVAGGEPVNVQNASKACFIRFELAVSIFLGGSERGEDEALKQTQLALETCRADAPKLILAVDSDLIQLKEHRSFDIEACRTLLRGHRPFGP